MSDYFLDGSDAARTAHEDEFSLLDMIQVPAANLRLLILGPIVIGLFAIGLSFLIKPTFLATTKFLVPQQGQSGAAAMLQSLGALGGLAGAASGIKNPADRSVCGTRAKSKR